MKKRQILAALLAVGLALPAPVTWAGSAEISQQGDYTFTILRQKGDKTLVKSREINEKQYERIKGRVERRTERQIERMQSGNLPPGQLRRCGVLEQNGNQATSHQQGSGNSAAALQTGSNNAAGIDQDGNGNIAVTRQIGANHQAQTDQDGSYNIAVVLQRCDNARPDRGGSNKH